MAWPLSQDYNEALQSPQLSFSDPELRRGRVVTNALGLPQPCSGNFADVYPIESADGRSKWAVKCFTREVPGRGERYGAISDYLRQLRLPFIVDFQHFEQGIRVGSRWYPLLKMQWVEGFTLNAFVRDRVDRPATLEQLLQIWLRMAVRLREARLAHCDLQHGNVLLVPGSTAHSLAVKLVDYDGMWVPELAQTRSGEIGHPNYQHPRRLREGTYSAEVDRFPLLVVATALRCLMAGGRALWQRHDSGDNLLFREADLRAPAESALFRELRQLNDPLARTLVEHLWRASQRPLEQTPLLSELIPEEDTSPPARSSSSAIRTAAANPFRNIDVPASGNRSRRRTARAGRRSVVPWIVGLVLLVSAAIGVALFSAMQAPEKEAHKPGNDKVAARKKEESKKPPPPKDRKPPIKEPSKPKGPPQKVPVEPLPARAFTNSIGMKLAFIPPGKFLMGTSAADIARIRSSPNRGYSFGNEAVPKEESPQHEVRITHGFHMGIYEVTQREYLRVMGVNPAKNKASPDHPVELVTWADAMKFCKRLSDLPGEKTVGRHYRLPTEAEWEYACRAGTTTLFHYGNTLSPKEANIDGRHPFGNIMKGVASRGTVRVGSYQPNNFGLYDMHGNVWEWCLDGERHYTPKPIDDPRGPEGDNHVLRGGGWERGACRSALRKERFGGYRILDGGLRVVCER